MSSSSVPLPEPRRRVVVLGASNVMRSLGHVVDQARVAWGSPLDLLVATGYGRSYGTDSRVLGRSLPGLLDCGIWRALRDRPPAPTAALLTDVGNDILYGASADRIVEWVETCLDRLRPQVEKILLTQLPLAGIDTVGAARFRLVRTLLFPSSSVSLSEARAIAHEVNERITDAARRCHADVVAPDPAWYGLDPVHVRRNQRRAAWHTILRHWADAGEVPVHELSAFGRLRLRALLPERRRFLGFHQQRSQPAATFSDGSQLSLY
jgi:hypothetical protein